MPASVDAGPAHEFLYQLSARPVAVVLDGYDHHRRRPKETRLIDRKERPQQAGPRD